MNKSLLPTVELARRYALGEPMASISRDAGISRVAVWRRLVAADVPRTRKEPPSVIPCYRCGGVVIRHRWRVMGAVRPFCSLDCYRTLVSEQGTSFVSWRQGQRIARRVVADHVVIPKGACVYHKDGNNRNNDVANLALYSSHSAHMNHHRGGEGRPTWDGGWLDSISG